MKKNPVHCVYKSDKKYNNALFFKFCISNTATVACASRYSTWKSKGIFVFLKKSWPHQENKITAFSNSQQITTIGTQVSHPGISHISEKKVTKHLCTTVKIPIQIEIRVLIHVMHIASWFCTLEPQLYGHSLDRPPLISNCYKLQSWIIMTSLAQVMNVQLRVTVLTCSSKTHYVPLATSSVRVSRCLWQQCQKTFGYDKNLLTYNNLVSIFSHANRKRFKISANDGAYRFPTDAKKICWSQCFVIEL